MAIPDSFVLEGEIKSKMALFFLSTSKPAYEFVLQRAQICGRYFHDERRRREHEN